MSSTADSSSTAIGASVHRASSSVGPGRLAPSEGSSSGAGQQGTSHECVPTIVAVMICLMKWALWVCQRMTPRAITTATGGRNSETKEYIWTLLLSLLIQSRRYKKIATNQSLKRLQECDGICLIWGKPIKRHETDTWRWATWPLTRQTLGADVICMSDDISEWPRNVWPLNW